MTHFDHFHPVLADWFRNRFGEPSEPQKEGWPLIQQGEHTLISAPTGSGKTLAAFFWAIHSLVERGLREELGDHTEVLYISPLKALANDVRFNLLQPLEEIRELARRMNLDLPEIIPLVRTGDTLASERSRMTRKPPHILVTTPESFYILLTTDRGREMLATVKTVIVDEIHAIARDKRGSHLSLSLERLEALTGGLQRIGLSATQKPIEEIACFLTGMDRSAAIVHVGHRREMDLAIEIPPDELGAVATNEMWEEIYDRLAGLIQNHQTTLVFVNTRRLAERVTFHLAERLGEDRVATHHGSLARGVRLNVEERLKGGKLQAVVATASLELGIDVGSIDLVCQVGSPRSIALALQRIGRSGHWKGAIPKGRIFVTTRDELIESAALVRAIRGGLLDRIQIPRAPLDILAQQIVAEAAAREWYEEELFAAFRKAAPYADLARDDFDAVVSILAEGISTRQGRRSAYLHRDRINGKIRARRGARLAAVTSGGAIPDNANYLVRAEPEETLVGTVDEDFAVESMSGDIFLLGNTSWRIRRIEAGVVRVEDAKGAPPSIPFWRGEAPARTVELSKVFAEVRDEIIRREPRQAVQWLMVECGLDSSSAQQAFDYIRAGQAALNALPTQECVVAERFFDESGGMQLVLHAPFGARINKAWGLALRKRFCRGFNFELQAAATDNGILISLSDQHSFPLESVFAFLSSKTVRKVLIQALLPTPLFTARWRWNVSRALGVLRFWKGRKVPPPLQRMRSDDLLAAIFPEQAACPENLEGGDIQVPDHPLVKQTVNDCLTEALDIEGLIEVLQGIEDGRIRGVARDTREPSPFSHEILNANPYAFLDDAPLEERRARAVQTRRSLPTESAELGQLDPAAIEQVVSETWPGWKNADELHDALLTLGLLRTSEIPDPDAALLDDLKAENRVRELVTPAAAFWFAPERAPLMSKVYPTLVFPDPNIPANCLWERDKNLDPEQALRELLRCRMECGGPTTVREMAEFLSLEQREVEPALHRLEAEGQLLRGSFRAGAKELEWCDRRLLARMHRLTLGRLRREIEPVSPSEFMRFLCHWQHTVPGTRLHGALGLAVVLEQLQGFDAPAGAWEGHLLPARMNDYESDDLDQLCLSGEFVWGRLSPPAALENGGKTADASPNPRGVRPSRVAPIAFFKRQQMPIFFAFRAGGCSGRPVGGRAVQPQETLQSAPHWILSHPAQEVLDHLQRWGACFFDDLVRTTGRLPLEVEEGLWELVAAGLATADGFESLRVLIDPKRKSGSRRRARGRTTLRHLGQSVGRWTLLRLPGDEKERQREKHVEQLAVQLLRRWGVVFRDLLRRESFSLPWRDALLVYRSMEARGQIRGGRFVSGFLGEQFALPEALDTLRALRRSPSPGQVLRVSAADPLNLTGIITPGPRIRPHPNYFLYLRDGVPVEEEEYLVQKSSAHWVKKV